VTGRLRDGRPFVVRHDPEHRLCVTLGDADFGCDDAGPAIGPNQDQTTIRLTAEVQGSVLAYGYLPEKAIAVVALFNDGRRLDDDVVSNGVPRVWALPLPPGVKVPGAPPDLLRGGRRHLDSCAQGLGTRRAGVSCALHGSCSTRTRVLPPRVVRAGVARSRP